MTRIKHIKDFFLSDLWCKAPESLPPGKRFGFAMLKRIVLTVRCFIREQLYYRAESLTYSTLFATVPLLAIIFAISRGFGFNKMVENMIRDSFSAQPEAIDAVIGFVNSYLAHTQSYVFIGFGLAFLFYTLSTLTSSIEETFNAIWQVKQSRTSLRKFVDYTAIFFLLPITIVLTTSFSIFLTTTVERMPDIQILSPTARLMLNIAPYALTGLMFTALYMFMPNTSVKFRSAAIGGFLAGSAFQLLQFIYIHSQLWVSSYNAIYGSFAALPLFMLFCQISWNICLAGAQLSFVDQNLDDVFLDADLFAINRRNIDLTLLLVCHSICIRFADAKPAPTAREIAKAHQLPQPLVADAIDKLQQAGIINKQFTEGRPSSSDTYQPAMALRHITPRHILQTLSLQAENHFALDLLPKHPFWAQILDQIYQEGFNGRLANLSLEELANEENKRT